MMFRFPKQFGFFLGAVIGVLIPMTALGSQQLSLLNPDSAVKLVFLGETRPILLHVDVHIDGKPVHKASENFFKQWFELLDRDGNGALSVKEAELAPSDQAMSRCLQNGYYFQYRGMMVASSAKKNANGEISWDTFRDFYRGKISPVLFSIGNSYGGNIGQQNSSSTSARVGQILLARLDANNDGKLSKTEVSNADKTLHFFDLNDDELITENEIVGVSGGSSQVYFVTGIRPGALQSPASGRLGDGAFYFLKTNQPNSGLALVLLSQYDRNFDQGVSRQEIGLPKSDFAELDKNSDGKLDVKELVSWHQRRPDGVLTVQSGKHSHKSPVSLRFLNKEVSAPVKQLQDGVSVAFDDALLQMTGESTAASQMMVRFTRARFYLQQFAQADKTKRKFVEKKDLNTAQTRLLLQIFDLVDRNSDGKMTESELKSFSAIVQNGPACLVSFSIIPQGRQLFRMMDGDKNGSLSIRELRSAWKHLIKQDLNKDSLIATNEILRQFQIDFKRGRPSFGGRVIVGTTGNMRPGLPKIKKNTGPSWFRKMDRNGDGDVSIVEFLGSRTVFDKIDANRDQLIDPQEAQRAEEIFSKK